METFGERLRRCREGKKMTQTELCSMLGKARHTAVMNWELNKNEPSLSEIRVLAGILGTTVGYLISGENEYGLKEGYVAVVAEDALKYERIMRKELEAENARLKNGVGVLD